MSSIDERVVAMRFNNSQFESGIKTSMTSLAGLKTGLNLDASKKSLDGLAEAGRGFSLAGIADGVQNISAKFSALSIVGITALTNIANKAINAGEAMVKSLTVDPIKAGLAEYELKMGSIQTILANTSKQGTTLKEVTASLDELNEYADKTIYNFGDMTKNIGLFTNAGIGIEDATSMIKGFSNEAAASGTNAEGAAGAAYQLSQALSAGTIRLMDWRSLTNVGMGNKNMQAGIIEIADAMGTFEGTTIDASSASADFAGTLEKGWLSADVMQNYLKIQAGELSDEQMTTLGLSGEQIESFKKQQVIAQDAAQKVRTWTQLLGTMQEGVGSGWSETFNILIGDFDQATEMWTNVNNTLGPMIGAAAASRNAMLASWASLGGRDLAIEAVKNAFTALMAIMTPIKEAFREIFPPMTGEMLLALTQKLTDFTSSLVIGGETAGQIKRIFTGVFSIFSILFQVVQQVVGVFGMLWRSATYGSGTLLEVIANVADFFTDLNAAVKSGEGFSDFFYKLGLVLRVPIELLRVFGEYVAGLFGDDKGPPSDGLETALDRVETRLKPITNLLGAVTTVFSHMGDVFKKVWDFFTPMANAVGEFFGELGASISESMATMDFSKTLDLVNTGLFAGLILVIKKFLGGGINIPGGGFLDTIRASFDGLTGTMSAMQAQLKAGTLLKIAGAIALLTVSVIALSLIDSAGLTRALSAMTVMFMQLFGAMAIFEKISQSSGFAKMPLIAAAMILLSVAVLILTVAVKNLSDLSWEELGKGLAGVAVLLGLLSGAAKLLSMNSGGLISAGIGMIAVAIAIKILVSAVKDFSEMNWEEMAQGLTGVALTLLALGLFTKLMDANKAGIAQSAGLILLAVALKILASVFKDFAAMNWEEMGQGLTGVATSLLVIAGAMQLMPKNMLVTAISLAIVGASLLILAEVLKSMAEMSWEELAQGITGIAASLLVIAGAMYLMTGALPGALALIIVAGALAIFVPVLQSMAAMSWAEIGMGLAALAAVFIVLGLAALVLAPVIPAMLGLGVAVTLLGIGTLAAGAGMLLFSAGLTALSIAGAAGTTALVAMVSAILALIPVALAALATGIVEFARIIGESGPVFVTAMTTLVMSLLTTINTVAPEVVATLINLIFLLVDALVVNVPRFVDAGLKMITGILTGISNNIDDIVAAALGVVTSFIDGIAAGIPDLVESAVNLIVTFVESLATSITNNSDRMNKAGGELATAIIGGITGGITAGVGSVVQGAKDLAKAAVDGVKGFLGINSPSKVFFELGGWSTQGLANGLTKTSSVVERASEGVGKTALSSLKKTMSNVASVVSNDMDLTPTIRPVLDLSDIQKGANLINGMLTPTTINPGTSYNKAAAIAVDARAAQQSAVEAAIEAKANVQPAIEFNQYNTSPKALSNAEIYRNTNNQLSVAKKGVLTK